MSKHTPGPWRVGPENTHGLLILNPKPGHPAGEMSVSTVSVFHSTGRSRAEGEANARLIAAAPDLLAALKDLLHMVDNASEAIHHRSIGAARAAIAKAEGA